MPRTAAHRAALAAEALDAYLRDHARSAPVVTKPWCQAPKDAPSAATASDDRAAQPPRRRSAAAPVAPADLLAAAPLRLPHTDWLRHLLLVAGPVSAVSAFQAAAHGAGTIPWHLDLDRLEEDWFHRLMAPAGRELSLAGARILAGQLRDAAERRHAIALSQVGRSQACPFDLHALVPVPPGILCLGPDHPDALGWLWQHWGTTEALRHVVAEAADNAASGQTLDAGEGRLRLSFWSADWTPWRAFEGIRASWPALRFSIQPSYATG